MKKLIFASSVLLPAVPPVKGTSNRGDTPSLAGSFFATESAPVSFCWVSYFDMSQDEFKQAVLDRRKKLQAASSASSAGEPLQ